jgi:hypothetical protein
VLLHHRPLYRFRGPEPEFQQCHDYFQRGVPDPGYCHNRNKDKQYSGRVLPPAGLVVCRLAAPGEDPHSDRGVQLGGVDLSGGDCLQPQDDVGGGVLLPSNLASEQQFRVVAGDCDRPRLPDLQLYVFRVVLAADEYDPNR